METTHEALLDISKLDRLAQLLTTSAIPFIKADEALRCELSLAGTAYGVAYFVPAEGLLVGNKSGSDAVDDSDVMFELQVKLFAEECNARPRKDLYLVVVGEAELLARPSSVRAACDIEQDTSYAKKEVMTPEQAISWLRGPFWHLAGNLRANAKPVFATVAHHRNEAAPKPNHSFNLDELLESCEEHCHAVREITDSVYRRVMGTRRKVFWVDGYPELGWDGDDDGVPVTFCSSGERIAFALALFLARAMVDVVPGMCLGFNATFDRLDTVRQIGAYDCLHQFVVATGASVVVYSSKKSLRDLLQFRVGKVISACGGTPTDYPETFF